MIDASPSSPLRFGELPVDLGSVAAHEIGGPRRDALECAADRLSARSTAGRAGATRR